jgi:hypothetical protein
MAVLAEPVALEHAAGRAEAIGLDLLRRRSLTAAGIEAASRTPVRPRTEGRAPVASAAL